MPEVSRNRQSPVRPQAPSCEESAALHSISERGTSTLTTHICRRCSSSRFFFFTKFSQLPTDSAIWTLCHDRDDDHHPTRSFRTNSFFLLAPSQRNSFRRDRITAMLSHFSFVRLSLECSDRKDKGSISTFNICDQRSSSRINLLQLRDRPCKPTTSSDTNSIRRRVPH